LNEKELYFYLAKSAVSPIKITKNYFDNDQPKTLLFYTQISCKADLVYCLQRIQSGIKEALTVFYDKHWLNFMTPTSFEIKGTRHRSFKEILSLLNNI